MNKKGQKAWNRVKFNDGLLRELYLDKRLTASQIAKEFGIGVGPVYRRLNELGIIRSNSDAHMGIRPSNFKGKFTDTGGYVSVHISEDHPYFDMAIYRRNGGGYVREHRLAIAENLGRSLNSWEVVHHKNGIRDDNRIENLELFPSQSEHQAFTIAHQRIKELEYENAELRAALAAEAGK